MVKLRNARDQHYDNVSSLSAVVRLEFNLERVATCGRVGGGLWRWPRVKAPISYGPVPKVPPPPTLSLSLGKGTNLIWASTQSAPTSPPLPLPGKRHQPHLGQYPKCPNLPPSPSPWVKAPISFGPVPKVPHLPPSPSPSPREKAPTSFGPVPKVPHLPPSPSPFSVSVWWAQGLVCRTKRNKKTRPRALEACGC